MTSNRSPHLSSAYFTPPAQSQHSPFDMCDPRNWTDTYSSSSDTTCSEAENILKAFEVTDKIETPKHDITEMKGSSDQPNAGERNAETTEYGTRKVEDILDQLSIGEGMDKTPEQSSRQVEDNSDQPSTGEEKSKTPEHSIRQVEGSLDHPSIGEGKAKSPEQGIEKVEDDPNQPSTDIGEGKAKIPEQGIRKVEDGSDQPSTDIGERKAKTPEQGSRSVENISNRPSIVEGKTRTPSMFDFNSTPSTSGKSFGLNLPIRSWTPSGTNNLFTPSSRRNCSTLTELSSVSSCKSPSSSKKGPRLNGKRSISSGWGTLPSIPSFDNNHEKLLNILDDLRAEGVKAQLDMSRIIVCGGPNSGKSSVIEAISGIRAPSSLFGPLYVVEFILRRSPKFDVKVSIIPDKSRSASGKGRISEWNHEMDMLYFPNAINYAGRKLDSLGIHRTLLKDTLHVELQGPAQPHLTLVEIPGLYYTADSAQEKVNFKSVESQLRPYLQEKRTLMLAVLSAERHFEIEKFISATCMVNKDIECTMGIITKPDTLIQGSAMEIAYFDLAEGKRKSYNHGCHVLMNKRIHEWGLTTEERNRSETEFLSNGIWASVEAKKKGINGLLRQLSSLLKDHILVQLPELEKELHELIKDTEDRLNKLGDVRPTTAEQRFHLLRRSERFTSLVEKAVTGSYLDPYFGDAMSEDGYKKRLRAIIQNKLVNFSDTVATQGHQVSIVEDGEMLAEGQIHRSEFIVNVQKRINRSRGRELPGTFNPMIVGDLFHAHCTPWERIVNEYTELILKDMQNSITLILQEVFDTNTLSGLSEHVLNTSLEKIKESVRSETKRVLEPQKFGHPITYNHYFLETLQMARYAHYRKYLIANLKDFFGNDFPNNLGQPCLMTFNMKNLVNALNVDTEAGVVYLACSEAMDCMLAYYKVAMKHFVDDYSKTVIEEHLMNSLTTLFSPNTVGSLDDSIIEAIASEDEDTKLERARLEKKLVILQRSLAELQRLDRHDLAKSDE